MVIESALESTTQGVTKAMRDMSMLIHGSMRDKFMNKKRIIDKAF